METQDTSLEQSFKKKVDPAPKDKNLQGLLGSRVAKLVVVFLY